MSSCKEPRIARNWALPKPSSTRLLSTIFELPSLNNSALKNVGLTRKHPERRQSSTNPSLLPSIPGKPDLSSRIKKQI